MLDKLSKTELQIILRCLDFILDSGKYHPYDISTILGVQPDELRSCAKLVEQVLKGQGDEADLRERYKLSINFICSAIGSSLLDIYGGSVSIKDDELESKYRISRKALRVLDHKLENIYYNETGRLRRSSALENLGFIDELIEEYRERLQRDPNQAYIHFDFAETLLDCNCNEEAIEHFSRAVELEPEEEYYKTRFDQVKLQLGIA